MKDLSALREFVCQHGIDSLLQRMDAVMDNAALQRLAKPVCISAKITNKDAVLAIIQQNWPGLSIKDVQVNLAHQSITFKVFGRAYVEPKYASYILFKDSYSTEPTEQFSKEVVRKEEYAESNQLSFDVFTKGLSLEYVQYENS